MVDETEVTQPEEPQGIPLVSVLYSARGDVYRIPSAGTEFWLSVEANAEGSNHIIASGRRYYKGNPVMPGHLVALPANDPLVVDYLQQVEAERL